MPRGVVRLDQDLYVLWSTVVDAPVGGAATRQEALAWLAGDPEEVERLERCGQTVRGPDRNGRERTAEEVVAANRAGPDELPLGRAALVRLVTEDDPVFAVGDIRPYTTSHAVGPGHELHGRVFWVPFDPADPPTSLAAVDRRNTVERIDQPDA